MPRKYVGYYDINTDVAFYNFSNLEAAMLEFNLSNLSYERNSAVLCGPILKGSSLKLTVPITCDIPHTIFGYLLLPTRDINVRIRTTI